MAASVFSVNVERCFLLNITIYTLQYLYEICIMMSANEIDWKRKVNNHVSALFDLRWLSYVLEKGENTIQNVKRHADGTFSNDFTHYLDKIKAKDFVEWLATIKREGWADNQYLFQSCFFGVGVTRRRKSRYLSKCFLVAPDHCAGNLLILY